MVKTHNKDAQAGTQHNPETSRPIIYTFPRPLFTQK